MDKNKTRQGNMHTSPTLDCTQGCSRKWFFQDFSRVDFPFMEFCGIVKFIFQNSLIDHEAPGKNKEFWQEYQC
jgi:hypothetical protein